MAVVEVLLGLFVFFEFHYFIRFILKCLYLHFGKCLTKVKRGVADEGLVYGICSTTDLDFMLHMNNARYLREIDFGRVEFLVKNGVFMAVRNMGGKMMQSACSIRYRRSITLFQIFRVRSKLLYWDDRNFYFEHRMETISDNFVRAIALEKQTLVGVTPEQVLDHLRSVHGTTVPARPVPNADLLRWIDSNELSSQRLTEESARSSTHTGTFATCSDKTEHTTTTNGSCVQRPVNGAFVKHRNPDTILDQTLHLANGKTDDLWKENVISSASNGHDAIDCLSNGVGGHPYVSNGGGGVVHERSNGFTTTNGLADCHLPDGAVSVAETRKDV